MSCYTYEHIDEEGYRIDIGIDYLAHPRRASIRDPERPEPAEPASIEILEINPDGIICEEEAEEIIEDMLSDQDREDHYERSGL